MRKYDAFQSVVVLSFLFIFATAPAYANAGTLLMWFTMFHLLIGNAIIGVIEGLVIASWWKLPKGFASGVMIGANYVSAFVGIALYHLLTLASGLNDFSIVEFAQLKLLLILAVIVLYLLTILIEWPFVRIIFRRSTLPTERPWLKSLKTSAVINLVSYTGLMVLVFLCGNVGILTKTVYDPSASFMQGRTGHIYYYDHINHEIHRMTLQGEQDAVILPVSLNPDIFGDYLFSHPSKHTGFWDLCVMERNEGEDKPKILVNNFSRAATDTFYYFNGIGRLSSGHRRPWSAMDFRKPSEVHYNVHVGFWPSEGLRVSNKKLNTDTHFGLETGFIQADSRNPTVLSGDIVVWEFGGRIMAMDLKSKHITQLKRGKSPVVTLD